MFQTFSQLEREILSSRIGKLSDCKQAPTGGGSMAASNLQISCTECSGVKNNLAVFECIQCLDHYCMECDTEVHESMELFRDHKRERLHLPLGSDQAKVCKWKKFEYFNFPVLAGNDHHGHLQRYFLELRRKYIEVNYIEADDRINLQSLFVDRQYDLLLEN